MASPKEYPQSEDGMRVLKNNRDHIWSVTQRFLGSDANHPQGNPENEKAETLDKDEQDKATPGADGCTQDEDTSSMTGEDKKENPDQKAARDKKIEKKGYKKMKYIATKKVVKIASLSDQEADAKAAQAALAAANNGRHRSTGPQISLPPNGPSEMEMMQEIMRGALQAQATHNAELQRFAESVQQTGRDHQATAAEGEPKEGEKKDSESLSFGGSFFFKNNSQM